MMRIDLVDPPAYSPAYDDALAAALARAGADVRLLSSPFAYGEVLHLPGYTREERFYRHAVGPAGSRLRTLTKLAEHVPDMLSYRRAARGGPGLGGTRARADVAHFQVADGAAP